MNKVYNIEVEIAGDFAIFADPTTGPDSVSYPVPTYSAIKGMLRTIAFVSGADFFPVSLSICRPIKFMTRNYNGRFCIARDSDKIKGCSSLQRRETILYDVVYQIKAEVKNKKYKEFNDINIAHALQEIFNRRVKKGQRFRTTCLGRSDFPALYVGPIRPENKPDPTINFIIDSLLRHPCNTNNDGILELNTKFDQNVVVKNGIIIYD